MKWQDIFSPQDVANAHQAVETPHLLIEYNEREKRELVEIQSETIRLAELARNYEVSEEV